MMQEEKRQSNIKNKKFWRNILVFSIIYFSIPVIIISFIVASHVFGCFSAVGNEIYVTLNEQPWIKQQSFYNVQQKEYELTIYEIRSPIGFSSSECMAVLKCDNKKVTQYEFYVSNDGKTLDEDNFNISWYDDYVILEVNGEEQQTAVYKFFYDGSFMEL